ncbi:MAG: beta-N-acetylglucosaminidase domain-containing protein [Bacteroidales bacterium]|nr:beta-N-acetylglucosaminidase domain-containing protein [Bacteroidales bacterium]
MNVKNITIIVFLTAALFGCKKDDQSRLQASWSAIDPVAIPLHNRMHEKVLGNVAPNPSFETGKIYYQENGIKSFDINGWKKVGDNIEWINSSINGTDINEIYDGIHSVKISREIADETEVPGEGIISDFIKVIPGNYALKLFLRLEDISPNQMRIGAKMYDAVNIRLKYFDKNKIEIDGKAFNAFNKIKIDNTFKAYSLSNYWDIKEFGWGEIHGKTANYPFFDGDIPDNARYVKIFIGLKATGTMWIDNVDFRFTKNNFTLLERLQPYFDSSYEAQDLVYPKPKQLIKKETVSYYNMEQDLLPVIVIPDNSNTSIKNMAEVIKNLLNTKIGAVKNEVVNGIQIVKTIDVSNISNDQFIISIGKSSLYNKFRISDSVITNLPNSYCILQSDSSKNLVFINAFDEEGFKNAELTFIQLLDEKNTVYHSADIIDYPDFLSRSLFINSLSQEQSDINEKLTLFSSYKLNNPYFEVNDKTQSNISNTKTDKYSILINLTEYLSDNTQYIKSLSESLNSVLIYDNRSYSEENNIDQKEYDKIIEEINKSLIRKNIKADIELFPYWNNLEQINAAHGKAEYFFREFKNYTPENLTVYWTGACRYSAGIDYADYHKIHKSTGIAPAIFDNNLIKNDVRFNSEYTMEYYAGKLRVLSFFEPYDPEYYKGYFEQVKDKKILLNTQNLSNLNAIRILTAANYFWNTGSYNSDWSLWVVLNKLYGRENAKNIIYFNDAYYGLKEISKKIEVNGVQYLNQRIARNFENDLNKYYILLENELNNKELIVEIEKLKTELLKEYYLVTESVK